MQPGNQPPADDPYGQGQYGQQPSQPPYPGATPTPGAGQPYPSAPPPAEGYGAPSGYGAPPPSQPNNTLGLLGMIFGIAGLVLSVLCGLFAIPFPIAGIVLGVLGMRRVAEGRANNRGMALAGVICGAIGVVISILFLIIGAALFASS